MLELRYKSSQETTATGCDPPEMSPISFRVSYAGVLVPIVWSTGKVECGHCGFVSASYPGLHKHMKNNHGDAMKKHERQMLQHGAVFDDTCHAEDDTCAPMLPPEDVEAFDIVMATKEAVRSDMMPDLARNNSNNNNNNKRKLGGGAQAQQPKRATQQKAAARSETKRTTATL